MSDSNATEIIQGNDINKAWANYSGDLSRLTEQQGIADPADGYSYFDSAKQYECAWPEHCTSRSLTDSEMMIRGAVSDRRGNKMSKYTEAEITEVLSDTIAINAYAFDLGEGVGDAECLAYLDAVETALREEFGENVKISKHQKRDNYVQLSRGVHLVEWVGERVNEIKQEVFESGNWCDRRTFKFSVDEENNAELWWDSARASDETPNCLSELIAGADTEASVEGGREYEEALKWCESLPGWANGPEYARTALVINEVVN